MLLREWLLNHHSSKTLQLLSLSIPLFIPTASITYLDTTANNTHSPPPPLMITYLWGCPPPLFMKNLCVYLFFGFSKIVVNGDYTSAKACACESVGACLERKKSAVKLRSSNAAIM